MINCFTFQKLLVACFSMKMQFLSLFLILTVLVVPHDGELAIRPTTIVIDSNVWINMKLLFDNIISEDKSLSELTRVDAYEKLWNEFYLSPNLETTCETYLKENKYKPLKETYDTIKTIIELKNKIHTHPVKVDIPIYVYCEITDGITSKISVIPKPRESENNYDEFISEFPLNVNIDYGILEEGVDFPYKDKNVMEKMKAFVEEITQNPTGKHANVNDLIKELDTNTQAKRTDTLKKLNEIAKFAKYVTEKANKFDKLYAKVIEHSTYSSKMKPLMGSVTKLVEYAGTKNKNLNGKQALIERLTKYNEEFDFFDLKIYLYAKKRRAHIMTSNYLALQEIYDPLFLDQFSDIKFLLPDINFEKVWLVISDEFVFFLSNTTRFHLL